MLKSIVSSREDITQVECPHLYQELNILLADMVGWKHLTVESDDTVIVSQSKVIPQKFDFFDSTVIFPIAEKYNKKANKVNDLEWSCEYLTADKKSMVVIAENQELALAMALVLEFCI